MSIYTTDLVRSYIDCGFSPIPVKFRSKQPINRRWTEQVISANNVENFFNGDPINIGVLMGEPSGGLVDIDIDNIEALKFAEWFLPQTNCVFGRASKPKSHWVYRVPDVSRRESFSANGVIVEIRGNNCFTVFPGSVHESGESVEFENPAEFTPTNSTWPTLKQAVQKMAIATALQQRWHPGSRHNLALSVSATLAQEGYTVDDVKDLIAGIATEACDEEMEDRMRCVEDTFDAYAAGKSIMGYDALATLVGNDVAHSIRRWLSGANERRAAGAGRRQIEPTCDLSNDAAAADAFAEEFSDTLIYCDERWYRRVNQVFEPISDAIVQGLAKEFLQGRVAPLGAGPWMLRGCLGRARINAAVELSRSKFYTDPTWIDNDPDLIGTADGTILNLRAGAEEGADRRIVTKKLGASADRNATCPIWLNFLDQIFAGDQELISFLQRAVGYTLTGSVEEQCLFILIGAGANGKSTLLRTLQRLFGNYAASIPMQSLMDQRNGSQQTNDLAYLVGKRLVTASEGERGQRLAESKIKQMTGGDRIVCRPLYRDFFEFQPQLKLWLATNNLPTISGTDEAIWRRIMVIPFAVTFAQEQQDKSLGSRLAEELPGILNWAMEGCMQWQEDGLSPPSQVVQSTRGYRAESDTVGQWIEAACIQEPRSRTSMKLLYESYKSWCENGALEALSNSCFGKELTRRGFESKRASAGNERLGIGIKTPDRF